VSNGQDRSLQNQQPISILDNYRLLHQILIKGNMLEIVEHETHKLYPIIYIHHYSYTKYDLNTVSMGSTPTTDLISSGINR
jgi:hypothetical protein